MGGEIEGRRRVGRKCLSRLKDIKNWTGLTSVDGYFALK